MKYIFQLKSMVNYFLFIIKLANKPIKTCYSKHAILFLAEMYELYSM